MGWVVGMSNGGVVGWNGKGVVVARSGTKRELEVFWWVLVALFYNHDCTR